MGVAAPVIVSEMHDWTSLGGGNSGIVGDANHSYGFHVAADELSQSDYSRQNDPNGPNGPFVSWDYCCAGDFSHKNDESLRARHRDVLARLMRGEMPMICEFIGKPWADQPVYYWARWNGVNYLERYTGDGHDTWSHISWYRSRVNERANLWLPQAEAPKPPTAVLHRAWPNYINPNREWFGNYNGPAASRGGYYSYERPDVKAIQSRLNSLGFSCGAVDGWFGKNTENAVAAWQREFYPQLTTLYGQVWIDDWARLFTY